MRSICVLDMSTVTAEGIVQHRVFSVQPIDILEKSVSIYGYNDADCNLNMRQCVDAMSPKLLPMTSPPDVGDLQQGLHTLGVP